MFVPAAAVGAKGVPVKVGDPAKRQAITNPTNTISSIKRFDSLNTFSDNPDRLFNSIFKIC